VLHAAFIETFNTTPHWAHRERDDGRRTPVEVLGWVKGQRVDPDRLRRLLGIFVYPPEKVYSNADSHRHACLVQPSTTPPFMLVASSARRNTG
jgi:hypothetical protein